MKIVLVIFLIQLVMVLSLNPAGATEKNFTRGTDCDLHHHPCIIELSDCTVTLDISPKPIKAMKDLIFRIILSGNKSASNPYIDLSMPGMDMGPNRVQLKNLGEGMYEGGGIIVRCPSGKKTWKATVTLPGLGRAEFIFDVIY